MTAAPRLYLLDVEGTTSPVSLVYEQLFPYARRHLEPFLSAHADEAEVRADLVLLLQENEADADPGRPGMGDAADVKRASAYLLWLMDRDRKSTALKSLQGKIWKAGFLAGELVGTVFDDVPDALDRWSTEEKVAIYSSGSVEAQRLLFGHSSAGDLTRFLSGYFDTRVGPKTAPESYRRIAVAMGIAPAEMLFLSDVVRELNPAREAGCQTRLILREGNAPVEDLHGHIPVRTFAEIRFESAQGRR